MKRIALALLLMVCGAILGSGCRTYRETTIVREKTQRTLDVQPVVTGDRR